MSDPIVATDDDLRIAVREAEHMCGFTYAELKAQHEAHRFESPKALIAWSAIYNLGDLA